MDLPKIIDNQRRHLKDVLIDASKNFEEISIATGYWDLGATSILLPHLKNYKKIRLLIGKEPLIPRYKQNEIEPDFPDKDFFSDLEDTIPNDDFKKTSQELKNLINLGILEVRIYRKSFLHAKCYIFGNYISNNAVGIIGSSNFTKNGLTSNNELNSLDQDIRIVMFEPKNENQEVGHLFWFDTLWDDEKSEVWTEKFIELVDTSNHGQTLFSPYEMYIKTLQFIYEDLLKEDRELNPLSERKLQSFQERSVKQILWRLEKNGVAMLADSVGLGKTITAIGVIKQYYSKRVIVIAPKSLVGQWQNEIAREKMLGVTVVSMQNKNQIDEEAKKDKYMPISLFVIDESHNLRSQSSKRFKQISEWIANNPEANTLLLTATPVNNSLDDLTNQILLGTRGEQDLLQVNFRNSQGVVVTRSFFDALLELKKKINQNRAQGNDMEPIYKEARQVIDPILREFVIRNTRQGILEELNGQGLIIDGKEFFFPEISVSNETFDSGNYNDIEIQKSIREIESHSIESIQETMSNLVHPLRQLIKSKKDGVITYDKSVIYKLYQYILTLSFIPYRSSMYDFKFYGKTIEEIKNLKLTKETSENLALQLSIYGFLRINFLKRFESSTYSLIVSVKKYQRRLILFEEILKKEGVLINLSDIDNILDEFSEENGVDFNYSDDELKFISKNNGKKVNNETYNIDDLLDDIQVEKKILESIIELSSKFNTKDYKLDIFLKKVKEVTNTNPERKILIFSFFADTIDYLKGVISEDTSTPFNSSNTLFVSGRENVDPIKAAERFAPNAKDARDRVSKEEEITYLFTTDVLAEGQNLQDCGLIINYDLHWNPVRMIQRNGRINRLGSPHQRVDIINLIPNRELDEFLGLKSRLEDKINLINSTIGSDSSVLGEEINPISYIGIYNSDTNLATEEYKRLEKEADIFTDDQFIRDLKVFMENSTEEEKNILNKIPKGKWGIIDKNNAIKVPEIIVFSKVFFSNNSYQFNFFLNNREGNSINLLINAEALHILQSNDKKRSKDVLTLNKNQLFSITSKNGQQIVTLNSHDQRLTPSQLSVLEEATIAGWSSNDRERLENLLKTRNVFQGKLARKLTKELRELIKNGQSTEVKNTLEKIRMFLPPELVKIKTQSVTPIFGYSRDNF